jgi:hypothetical protein
MPHHPLFPSALVHRRLDAGTDADPANDDDEYEEVTVVSDYRLSASRAHRDSCSLYYDQTVYEEQTVAYEEQTLAYEDQTLYEEQTVCYDDDGDKAPRGLDPARGSENRKIGDGLDRRGAEIVSEPPEEAPGLPPVHRPPRGTRRLRPSRAAPRGGPRRESSSTDAFSYAHVGRRGYDFVQMLDEDESRDDDVAGDGDDVAGDMLAVRRPAASKAPWWSDAQSLASRTVFVEDDDEECGGGAAREDGLQPAAGSKLAPAGRPGAGPGAGPRRDIYWEPPIVDSNWDAARAWIRSLLCRGSDRDGARLQAARRRSIEADARAAHLPFAIAAR